MTGDSTSLWESPEPLGTLDGGVPLPESMKDVPILVKCATCRGKGEVYAEAPWCRWFPCGVCGGRGLV